MAAKRSIRSKTLDDTVQEIPPIQSVEKSRSRTKNYTTFECQTLLRLCDQYHNIINRNSSRDIDRKNKELTWQTIKNGFDERCKAEGQFVSSSE